MKRLNLVLHVAFAVIVVIQLFGSWVSSRSIEYAVKPLILLWIATFFLLNSRPARYRWLVLLAFFFSWLGDLVLMFAWKSELLFFAGVGGFLCSQITYILAFLTYRIDSGKGLIRRKPVWLLAFGLYFAVLFLILLPGLDGIMIPVVVVYALSLTGMSIAAANRHGLVSPRDFALVFSGSVLFLISDSLLAINKFITDLPREGFLVMLTYIAAQYLIMRGMAGTGIPKT